jgi:hypothetical protein
MTSLEQAMPVYTVHAPPATRGRKRVPNAKNVPENYIFVRDGFYVWAMIFGPFWMLFRRLWLVFFLYLVLMVALGVTLWALGVSDATGGLPMLLVSVLIGLEAGSLWRWTLARRRYRNVGVVVGDNVEAAERRFFDRLAHEDAAPARVDAPYPPPMTPPRPMAPQPVTGLFPEPGASR